MQFDIKIIVLKYDYIGSQHQTPHSNDRFNQTLHLLSTCFTCSCSNRLYVLYNTIWLRRQEAVWGSVAHFKSFCVTHSLLKPFFKNVVTHTQQMP